MNEDDQYILANWAYLSPQEQNLAKQVLGISPIGDNGLEVK